MKKKTLGNLMPLGLGLDYTPVNEQGVVFLFDKYHEKLGIEALQCIRNNFPDAIGRIRKGRGQFTEIGIEFEYRSSGFKEHIKKNQYNKENCHMIVCWEHDWRGIPAELEMIELKTKIQDLLAEDKLPKAIKSLSNRQKEYLDFFDELLNGLKSRLPALTKQKALPQSWCSIPVGISGVHLEWQVYRRPTTSLAVGLDMERGKEDNEKLFNHFKSQEESLKKELGNDLCFQYPWGKKVKWARIYKKMSFDAQDKLELEKIKKWGLETMTKFHSVFEPYLHKIKREILRRK